MSLDTPTEARLPIASLVKGLRVFEALASTAGEISLHGLMTDTGLDRVTIHRILRTLIVSGFIERHGRGRYGLATRSFMLGNSLTGNYHVVRVALPIMRDLQAEIDETVNLAILDGSEVVYVARLSTGRFLTVNLQVGSRLPAYCTSLGRALLAFVPLDEAEAVLRSSNLVKYTPKTIVVVSELLRELTRTRERGYALTNQELELGLRSIAFPVTNGDNRAVAAMNVSVPAARMSQAALVTTVRAPLAHAAARLSRSLGLEP